MKTIDLTTYSPIISDKEIGNEIYILIKETLASETTIIIDMAGIKSMATFCAKQIFGKLYVEIGPTDFFERIVLKNATDDLKSIIKVGIQNAIEDIS